MIKAIFYLFVDSGSDWVEVFPVVDETSETVKVYLSQLFARFGIGNNLVTENSFENESDSLNGKQRWEPLGAEKMIHLYIIKR